MKETIQYLESLRPVLAECERYLLWMDSTYKMGFKHKVVVTVEQHKRNKWQGQFGVASWSTREGEPVHVIRLGAEDLQRDVYEILCTLHHEGVHYANQEKNIVDCGQNGRHNKLFRESAEDAMLEVKNDKRYGWALTSMTPELRKEVEEFFKPDLASFRIFQNPPAEKEAKPRAKRVSYSCGCPVNVMVAQGVEFKATCNLCAEDFVKGEAPK